MCVCAYTGVLMCICVCLCVCMDTYAIESGCHLLIAISIFINFIYLSKYIFIFTFKFT